MMFRCDAMWHRTHQCLAAAAVLLPVVASILSAQEFEVASVKLNKTNERSRVSGTPAAGRLVITGMTVKDVIRGAYGIPPFELAGDDSLVLNQRIDIEASAGHPVASTAQLQEMLQPLLADRFKLAVHLEMREMSALVLVLANKDGRLGPKMKMSNSACDEPGTGPVSSAVTDSQTPKQGPACGSPPSGVGRIVGIGLDMPKIVGTIAPSQRMPVVDQTGLKGRYDIDVTYTPEPFSTASLAQRGGAPMQGVDPDGPPLFKALEEQLGLKMLPKKMLVPVYVIDHIEPLSEN